MELIDLANKTIIVTGAASGIGRRTAELLLDVGASVIALDRTRPPQEVSRFIQVDLAEPASIEKAVTEIGRDPIDGLCNIAGVPGTQPDDMVGRINYLGLRHLTWALRPLMPSGSSVVNLASMAGWLWRERAELLWQLAQITDWDKSLDWIEAHPFLNDQSYRRFKEALIVWTLANASDWMQRFGIRMNCVSPGPVDTPIFEDFKKSLGRENVADIINRTGRAATPDDIAPVVLFLLSDAARWIVGVDLPTEGGLTSSRFISDMRPHAA